MDVKNYKYINKVGFDINLFLFKQEFLDKFQALLVINSGHKNKPFVDSFIRQYKLNPRNRFYIICNHSNKSVVDCHSYGFLFEYLDSRTTKDEKNRIYDQLKEFFN